MEPATTAAKTFALICYAIALAGAVALGARVLLLGLDLPHHNFVLPYPWPWIVNLFWLLLFGIQHSGMARRGFKNFSTRLLPSHLERSAYVALAGVVLLGLAGTWQPLVGEAFWRLPRGLIVAPLTAVVGLAAINLRFDHAGFFGLRQVWEHAHSPTPERLLVQGPYRWVRHPLMACLLVFLWAQPIMTPTLFLLSGGLTLYVIVGIMLEERDLLHRFGSHYADYRRRVPALVPWRAPAPPATYGTEGPS